MKDSPNTPARREMPKATRQTRPANLRRPAQDDLGIMKRAAKRVIVRHARGPKLVRNGRHLSRLSRKQGR
jgi:hypothetical protein